ncbi:MAG: sulfatase-like hydrolase/transferase [Clostridia bacterium]|nr:sulfatase-like hydrolase/transferase [Clostridia bacterium]
MLPIKRRIIAGIVLLVLAAVLAFALVQRQKNLEAERIAAAEAASVAAEEASKRHEEELEMALEASADPNQIISLSKKQKNVIVIMLDRAVGCYFPYIMEEMPEVKKQFDGFTFYPNTSSFGTVTIYGVPAVYGGYEYTPEAMNARTEEKLVDKHNEALKMMPKLFTDNGFKAVVCDPAIANYQWTPDLTIFDDIKNVDARNYLTGATKEGGELSQYDKFMLNYDFLSNLNNLTNNRSRTGKYIAIDNEITHRYLALNWPDYTPMQGNYGNYGPRERTRETGETIYLNTPMQLSHYHVNTCAMKLLGNWFDYLRELGVYDNTRIIIVSDHGYGLGQYESMQYGATDLLYYNALLLFKDFNSDEPIKYDDQLMTNADTPYLATNGLIKNAKNPYTGKVIAETVKKDEIHPYIGHNWQIETNQGNTFGGNTYFVVHDNIFDINNWSTTRINPGG